MRLGPPVVRSFGVNAFSKRQNETRNRSLTFKNAFPPRETDQNFLKTPFRGGKWGKFSEKRLPAAGNGKKSQKNGFLRREGDKIARKTASCGGKASKSFGDRFRATGKGAYRIRPQDVSNGNDFAYPYKWNRNRLPQMSAPPLASSMYLGA